MVYEAGGHKRRSGKMLMIGDISAVIEMARLEATELADKDPDKEAFKRGVEAMRSRVRETFEDMSEMKLPEVQAVRKKSTNL